MRASRSKPVPVRSVLWILLCLVVLWGLGAMAGRSGSIAANGLFQSDLPTATGAAASPTSTVPAPATAVPSPTLAATIVPDQTPEPSSAPQVSASPTAWPTSTREPSQPRVVEGPRYPEERAPVEFRWQRLIDSLALVASYVWLGCGIGFLVLLVGSVAWVWRRGRRGSS